MRTKFTAHFIGNKNGQGHSAHLKSMWMALWSVLGRADGETIDPHSITIVTPNDGGHDRRGASCSRGKCCWPQVSIVEHGNFMSTEKSTGGDGSSCGGLDGDGEGVGAEGGWSPVGQVNRLLACDGTIIITAHLPH
jgi:hypothetical protein